MDVKNVDSVVDGVGRERMLFFSCNTKTRDHPITQERYLGQTKGGIASHVFLLILIYFNSFRLQS